MYQLSASMEELIEIDKKYRAYLEEQLMKNPRNIHVLIHLGVLCWEPFHEEEKAIIYLEKAIEYDPKNVEARFWLAKCYYHDLCDYDKAKQIILEALQIDSRRPDCLSLLATVVWDDSDSWEEAINYLEKAIQLAPNWPILRILIGSLYIKLKKVAFAEQQIKKIEELTCLPRISPKNAIEDYYESIVTGRSNQYMEENLNQLKNEVWQVKASLS